MKKLPKINDYELLRGRVYRILKNKIIEGELEEGAKITEAEIANQMGVSKTPIREALRRLVIEGFITLHPNKRMTITKISPKDIKEVFQLRKVLNGLAARLVAEKITEDNIVKFNKIIQKMKSFARQNEIIKYSKCADGFHFLMMQLSGNERLEKLNNNLRDQAYRYRIKSLKEKGRIKESLKEHQKILDAFITRNPEESCRLCQEHIDNALNNILQNAYREN